MPARKLAFTSKNILKAWEAVGIIPFNPRRVLGAAKQEYNNLSHGGPEKDFSLITVINKIPATSHAVSRTTRNAISLVTRNTPGIQKLKSLLSGLSAGF